MRSRRCSPARRSGCSRSSRAFTTRPGATSRGARRERLLELARRHGFFILEDGIYGDLRFAGADPRSLRSEAPAHVVYVDSLSKTLSGGLRIGWVGRERPGARSDHRRETLRRHPQPDAHPARRRPLPGRPALSRRRRRWRPASIAERLEAMQGSIERHLGSVGDLHRAARRRAPVARPRPRPSTSASSRTKRSAQGVAYVPGAALRTESSPDLRMRLSFGFLDAPAIDEGLRRIAKAITSLRARPSRRRGCPGLSPPLPSVRLGALGDQVVAVEGRRRRPRRR